MENKSLLYIVFQFWEGTSVKSYFLFLISCFTSVWISVDINLDLFNVIWNRFSSQIFLFKQIHPTPHLRPLNGQNLLSVKKKFVNFLEDALWNIFSKNLLAKSCKNIQPLVSLNKVVTIDALILFSEPISKLAILTQASYYNL